MSEDFQDFQPDAGHAGLSEMSEELDAGLWKGRIMDAWGSVVAVAQKREDAAAWFAAWFPAVMAAQALGTTAWRTIVLLKEVSTGEVEGTFDEIDWTELREEFSDLQEVFPDAGHLLFGASLVDDFIDDVISNDETRAQASVLLAGVERLVDDVVARMIDIWVHPEKAKFATEAKISLEHIEAILQAVLDRLMAATR